MAHTWRSFLFGIDGWRNYLKSGYDAAAKRFDDAPFRRDLTGVRALVTGANQGIGFEVTRQLASQGASVTMVCRDRGRGQAALERLWEERLKGTLALSVCDISNQRAVKALADGIVASGEHVNILVNNAGCMVHERTVTPEGVEANFATNTLGTWALTESLLPAMRQADDPRVVTVSSAGMLTEKLSTSDLEWTPGGKLGKFDGKRQYARGKRHQVALTEQWSRDACNAQVLFVSMHPGWSDTQAVRDALPGFYDSLKGKLRTPREGADTVAWLCVAPRDELTPAGFYLDRKAVPKHVSTNFLTGTSYKEEKIQVLREKLKSRLEEALKT